MQPRLTQSRLRQSTSPKVNKSKNVFSKMCCFYSIQKQILSAKGIVRKKWHLIICNASSNPIQSSNSSKPCLPLSMCHSPSLVEAFIQKITSSSIICPVHISPPKQEGEIGPRRLA